jgi:hypothetical protein
MKKLLTMLILGLMACGARDAGAANLLLNGDLDDPGDHEIDLALNWTLEELRQSGPGDTATFARFGNHTPNPNDPGPDPDMTGTGPRVGAWFKNFTGTPTNLATAHLYQDVPGTPGTKYAMTGWSRFESFYAGGLDQVPSIDPVTGQFILSPSPTDTFFALDFLGPGDAVISSAQLELKADGQLNFNQWRQHMLMATAPAGTVEVRVRASAVNMVGTLGSQSAFVDDFTLSIIPEPASVLLGLIGLAAIMGGTRRR